MRRGKTPCRGEEDFAEAAERELGRGGREKTRKARPMPPEELPATCKSSKTPNNSRKRSEEEMPVIGEVAKIGEGVSELLTGQNQPHSDSRPPSNPRSSFEEKAAQLSGLQEELEARQEDIRRIEEELTKAQQEFAEARRNLEKAQKEMRDARAAMEMAKKVAQDTLDSIARTDLWPLQIELITCATERAEDIQSKTEEVAAIAECAGDWERAEGIRHHITTAMGYRKVWLALTPKQRIMRTLQPRISPESAQSFYWAAYEYLGEEPASAFLNALPPSWKESIEEQIRTVTGTRE